MQLRHVPHSRIRRIVWELLDKSGNPITQRTDTSVGVMTVPPLSACLHLTFVLPQRARHGQRHPVTGRAAWWTLGDG